MEKFYEIDEIFGWQRNYPNQLDPSEQIISVISINTNN